MPGEVRHSPPLHRPGEVTSRPKGILKNPSFSGDSGHSPEKAIADPISQPPSAALDPQDAKEITIQNTLQNAGHRRSSSAAERRSSASRRHSSAAGIAESSDDNPDHQRLKWDEANLYLAEQESGGRMKITEPKTPFEYGNKAMDEDDDEEAEVAIDPRYVNVDEMEMTRKGSGSGGASARRKARESEIPGLELGEPEDEGAGAEIEDDRIVRSASKGLSRESSKEKHVSVDGEETEQPGMPTREEKEKHAKFEAQRRKHYEMKDVKDMLGHPESLDDEDDEDVDPKQSLSNRGLNGV